MGKYLKFTFQHGSLAEYDQLVRLEEILVAELPESCLVDGHDFGRGRMALFVRAKGKSNPSDLILDLIQSHSDLECLEYDVREVLTKKTRWRSGDILMAVLLNGRRVFGRFLAHDRAIGPVMLVYDSMGLGSTELSEIIESQIIVRATGLHRDIAATGEWTVVGHIPLTKEEADLVEDAPGVIAGENNQLIAANIYYGLSGDTAIVDVDDYLNSDNHPIPATFYFGQHPFPAAIEILLMQHKDNEYFLDEIWCDAVDWAKGFRLDEAQRILTEGAS